MPGKSRSPEDFMRVVYISQGYTTHDHHFLTALARAFNHVFLLRLSEAGNGSWVDLGIEEIVPETRPDSPTPTGVCKAMPQLRAAIKKAIPDVIIGGPIQTAGLCAVLARTSPVAIVSWGSDLLRDPEIDPSSKWMAQFVLQKCDIFVCDCDAVRHKALESLHPEIPIIQFPWGTDLQRFHPAPPPPPHKEQFTFLHTRSFETVYNVDTLISGFALATHRTPNIRLDLAGDGSMRYELENLVESLGIRDKVRFLGRVRHDELPRLFRNADAYISASLSDGSSVSLLEAMASGLVVTVSAIPGNREWVANDVNGYLFATDDPEGIAEAIIKTTRLDEKKRREVAAANREICETKADWTVNISKLTAGLKALTKDA